MANIEEQIAAFKMIMRGDPIDDDILATLRSVRDAGKELPEYPSRTMHSDAVARSDYDALRAHAVNDRARVKELEVERIRMAEELDAANTTTARVCREDVEINSRCADKAEAAALEGGKDGGWIAGSIIDASEPFRSVEPTFVGKPIWTWRESDGQWFRHDPLPALPKEK